MNEERNNQPQAAEPSLSEILQVRRDKLKALQDAGRNPFEQTRFARSAYSADIKEDFEAIFEASEEILPENLDSSWYRCLIKEIMQLFAPML